MLAVWRNPEEQKPGSATNLPDTPGFQCQDPVDRCFDPDAHFLSGDCLSRVAAFPSGDIESRFGRVATLAVRFIEGHGPLGDLLCAQPPPGLIIRWSPIMRVRNDVCDESFVSWLVFSGKDGALLDGRVLGEDGFDFSQFNAEAADLDLLIGASQVLDLPICKPAAEVSGAVHALTGAEGVGHEALFGEVRLPVVPSGKAVAGQIEFPGNPHR